MSEYWKSTPKYFCKFCKDFVKDTKFERTQHEATPRHQGNIQRSLRTLHKEKEQEDRAQQRAKDEIARLNGVVGGKGAGSSTTPALAVGNVGKKEVSTSKQASMEERKRQIKQLADMGVAVPEEFRREMALAGEWQTVSVTSVKHDDISHLKAGEIAFGVRKRKLAEEEAEEAAEEEAARKQRQWGSRFKTYPGNEKSKIGEDGEVDVEALLSGIVTKSEKREEDESVKKEALDGESAPPGNQLNDLVPVVKEESQEEKDAIEKLAAPLPGVPVKAEASAAVEERPVGAGIVFKKRKPKVVRQG
jgi:hypothetical protein